MRKKIRNVLAVAAAIITVLSINPLFSMADMPDEPIVIAVSYTHLTLPTILRV